MRARRVVRRKVVLDHPYFHVELATERDAKGREHTYIHGTGPDIAFAVPVWPDGTVTLNKQRRFGMAEPSVEVPGGHVDEGETPLAAVRRELREETGLVARRVTHLVTCFSSIKVQQRVHMYLAEGLREGVQELDDDEEIETVRLPLDTAIRRARRGWMVHGPSILALYAAQDHLRARSTSQKRTRPTRSA
jgi:ADP-ribose pyrophosphatase